MDSVFAVTRWHRARGSCPLLIAVYILSITRLRSHANMRYSFLPRPSPPVATALIFFRSLSVKRKISIFFLASERKSFPRDTNVPADIPAAVRRWNLRLFATYNYYLTRKSAKIIYFQKGFFVHSFTRFDPILVGTTW